MISEMIEKGQSSPPNEWGKYTNHALWNCNWDGKSAAGRNTWKGYKLDALCCSS